MTSNDELMKYKAQIKYIGDQLDKRNQLLDRIIGWMELTRTSFMTNKNGLVKPEDEFPHFIAEYRQLTGKE